MTDEKVLFVIFNDKFITAYANEPAANCMAVSIAIGMHHNLMPGLEKPGLII